MNSVEKLVRRLLKETKYEFKHFREDMTAVRPLEVINNTGSTINKGVAVYVSGWDATEGYAEVTKADADGAGTYPAVGLMLADTDDGDTGVIVGPQCMCEIDTSSWSAGDELYLHTTAGELSSTAPIGDYVQSIATVVYSNATHGILAITPSTMDGAILTLAGTSVVTKALEFPSMMLKNGTTQGTPEIVGDYYTIAMSINDDAICGFTVPHDWDAGTNILVYVQWQIDRAYGDESGEVQWQIDWSATPVDSSEAISGPTHNGSDVSGDINIPATARFLISSLAGTIAGASLAAGDAVGLTVSRVAIDDGTDPGGGKEPGIVAVHVHYQSDSLGEAV